MTLRIKLFVLVAAVIIFATTGVTAIALWREVIRGQELLEREGSAMASQVATAAARWLGPDGAQPGARDAVQGLLDQLLLTAPLERAWVADRDGRLVACASRGPQACPAESPLSQFQTTLGPLEALDRLVHPQGIVARSPVLRDGALAGAVYVDFMHEEVVGNARRLGYGVAVVAAFWIGLGHVLAAVLLRHITRPLTEVVQAAESLAQEKGIQLEVPEDRELAELVNAVNRMSSRLSERREENQRLIESLEERVAQKTREVLRADRLATLGGIAAGFAHELGNSLNVIRGYTAVVLRELPGDHPNRPDLEAVRREVTRAASLLERFLVFARARTVRPQVQPIEPVLREAVEVVGPAAAEAGVETAVRVDPDVPPVKADGEMLRQAFLNLCVNAVQAMQPDGGQLSVRLRREGDGVAVEFQDSGPGMAEETRRRVFEPFYTTKADGTGLGLAIVRQAAEAHGGTVEVESAPGKGALFRMRLPSGQEEAAA